MLVIKIKYSCFQICLVIKTSDLIIKTIIDVLTKFWKIEKFVALSAYNTNIHFGGVAIGKGKIMLIQNFRSN